MDRSRCFSIVLYPEENEKDKETLKYITDNFEYAYINHTEDIAKEDIKNDKGEITTKKGEKKKAHTHCIFCFKNARYISSIKEELEINYVESANFYAQVRYLIHLGYPQKHQYNSQEIKTNIPLRVENALKKDYRREEEDSRILLDFIFKESNQSYLTFRKLTEFALENDCLTELQKRSYFYNQFCDQSGFRRI